MSSRQDVKTHHKTRTDKCKGRLLDSEESYGKWAYWCPNRKIAGWSAVPCQCDKKEKYNARFPYRHIQCAKESR